MAPSQPGTTLVPPWCLQRGRVARTCAGASCTRCCAGGQSVLQYGGASDAARCRAAVGSTRLPAVPGGDQGTSALSTSPQGARMNPAAAVHKEKSFFRALFRKSQCRSSIAFGGRVVEGYTFYIKPKKDKPLVQISNKIHIVDSCVLYLQ